MVGNFCYSQQIKAAQTNPRPTMASPKPTQATKKWLNPVLNNVLGTTTCNVTSFFTPSYQQFYKKKSWLLDIFHFMKRVIQILSLDFCFCPSVLNKLWLLFFLCGLWGDFFPYFYNFTVIIYFFNFWLTFFVHETNFGLEYWGIFFHFSIQFWGRLFGC